MLVFNSWYGRGPHENYSDRNRSALIRQHRVGNAEELHVPYIFPGRHLFWRTLTVKRGHKHRAKSGLMTALALQCRRVRREVGCAVDGAGSGPGSRPRHRCAGLRPAADERLPVLRSPILHLCIKCRSKRASGLTPAVASRAPGTRRLPLQWQSTITSFPLIPGRMCIWIRYTWGLAATTAGHPLYWR